MPVGDSGDDLPTEIRIRLEKRPDHLPSCIFGMDKEHRSPYDRLAPHDPLSWDGRGDQRSGKSLRFGTSPLQKGLKKAAHNFRAEGGVLRLLGECSGEPGIPT